MKLQFTGNGKADKDEIIAKAKRFISGWDNGMNEGSFQWDRKKSHREAFADALGIGFTALRYLQNGGVKGCYTLIKGE